MDDAIQSRPIWMPEQGYRARYGWLHKPAMHVLLSSDLLYTSRLYRVLEPTLLQPLCLGACAGLILLYTGMAWLRLHILPLLLLIFGFALVVNQMLVFSNFTHIPLETNSIFQYMWIFTFIVFFCACKDGHGNFVVRQIFFYATAYAAIYVLLAALNKSGALPSYAISGIILTDPERGDRLFSYGIAINFAWFAWLYRAKVRMNLNAILALTVCLLAFYFMMSRVATLILLIISITYIFGFALRSIRFLALAIFVAVAIPNLYGLYDPAWNPFALFSGDSSGGFRTLEYELARSFIWQNPVFGFGIAPTPKAASFLLDNDFFSASDLGPIGVWFDYGLCGLILFLLAIWIACKPITRLYAHLAVPLSLTGCFMASYACLSPILFTGGATFFAVIFGVWLGTQPPGRRIALPWSHPEQRLREQYVLRQMRMHDANNKPVSS